MTGKASFTGPVEAIVHTLRNGGTILQALAKAQESVSSGDAVNAATLGAANSLAAQFVKKDRHPATHYNLSSAGLTLSIIGFFQAQQNNKFDMDDIVAFSALMGATLGHFPVGRQMKIVGAVFNLIALAPAMGELAAYLVHDYRTNGWWNQAKNWTPPRIDPLALDLDGDGIETRGADGKVVFDHNGDGVKTGTGWLRPDDGWLVLDRNSNGTIDNGGELFGVDTVKADGTKATDGFDALSDLDSNNDNVFDAKDTRFADVRVWRDLNQDGVSQSNELSTLAANNIRSINLNKTSATTNLGNGNTQTATATFTRTDDTTGTAANLGLVSNTFYRQFTNRVTLTDNAKKLPEVSGSGRVRNLREAMSRYSTLNEYRLPPGSGNGGFIAGAKHTWGPAHE